MFDLTVDELQIIGQLLLFIKCRFQAFCTFQMSTSPSKSDSFIPIRSKNHLISRFSLFVNLKKRPEPVFCLLANHEEQVDMFVDSVYFYQSSSMPDFSPFFTESGVQEVLLVFEKSLGVGFPTFSLFYCSLQEFRKSCFALRCCSVIRG